MTEPVLKWAGGKRDMLDEILPRLPPKSEFERYFEPFVGGGAVFFSLRPNRAYISDINPRLVNFYKQIKHNPERIIERNIELDKRYKDYDDEEKRDGFYYQKRDEFNALRNAPDDCRDEFEEAALLLFLNRTCFNGLYRTNEQGDFNVPVGTKWTEVTVIERRIREAHRALRAAAISRHDFTHVRERAEENDLVFFDPPYPSVRKSGSFEGYHPGGFDFERHKELQEIAFELDRRGVYVLITNGNDENTDMEKENYVKDLYSEDVMPDSFRTMETEGQRAINSDSTKRTDIGPTDIIVTNCPTFNDQMEFADFR